MASATSAAFTAAARETGVPSTGAAGWSECSRECVVVMAYIQSQSAAARTFPRRSVIIALASLAAAFAVVLSGHSSGFLQRFELAFSDFRTAWFSDRITTDHPDIVIVSVGDNVTRTQATFDRRTIDVDRAQLARLIDAIDDSAPRAIGFDIPLAGAGDPAKDQALQRALRESKARVVIGLRSSSTESNVERRAWLNRYITGTGRPVGHITTIYDEGLTRAVRVDSGEKAIGPIPDSFALLVSRALRPETRAEFGNIAWLQKVSDSGILARYVNLGSQQPFRTLLAEDLIDNTRPLPTRQLAGRLVLVTSGLAEIERHRTPLTAWSGEALAPIQIQAQAIAQMLDRRGISEISSRTLRLALFTLACIAGLVGWYRGPGWHIPATLLTLGIIIALDAMAFAWRDLALPLVPALIVWLLGEIAGRSLRHILNWELRNGLPWPIEASRKD